MSQNKQYNSAIIYIDTETTGIGDMSKHRIIELALVKVPNIYDFHDHVIFHTHLDIEPEIEITKGSFMVHGISREQLKGKPKFEDIADDMLAFLANHLIIGHNVQFDIDFVNASLKRMGRENLTNKTIDSRLVAAQKFPGSKVGLDKLIEKVLGLPPRGNHSALEDALYLAKIYPKLQKEEEVNLFTKTNNDPEPVEVVNDYSFFDSVIGEKKEY